jgi:hypothetical protein
MCAQEVHIYIRMKKYQKQCYVFNIRIAIITLTSEYRGTVTKLQAPFLSGTADWGALYAKLFRKTSGNSTTSLSFF